MIFTATCAWRSFRRHHSANHRKELVTSIPRPEAIWSSFNGNWISVRSGGVTVAACAATGIVCNGGGISTVVGCVRTPASWISLGNTISGDAAAMLNSGCTLTASCSFPPPTDAETEGIDCGGGVNGAGVDCGTLGGAGTDSGTAGCFTAGEVAAVVAVGTVLSDTCVIF